MNLLEYIAEKVGEPILYNLKGNTRWIAIARSVDPWTYPIEQWNETISYLTGEKSNYASVEEAKKALKYIKKKR